MPHLPDPRWLVGRGVVAPSQVCVTKVFVGARLVLLGLIVGC